MSDFTPDASQLLCLKTWYVPKNPLHLDPRHPCIKLAGEAGELLDLYGKHEYKPNFSWWRCKNCGFIPEDKKRSDVDYYAFTYFNSEDHAPLVLDELGDYSYYLRILCYQQQLSFESLCEVCNGKEFETDDMVGLLCELSRYSLLVLRFYRDRQQIMYLNACADTFMAILHKLDCSLEKLLDLNYQKLNTAIMNGWKDARF